MDLRRTIIIIMFLSCVTNVIGIVHCHLNYPTYSAVSIYEMSYSIIFPILLCLTSFLLIEQFLITDGTVAPLNRLRTVYALVATMALLAFGIGAAVIASRSHASTTHQHSADIACVIAFVGMIVYFAEALARNRKNRII